MGGNDVPPRKSFALEAESFGQEEMLYILVKIRSKISLSLEI